MHNVAQLFSLTAVYSKRRHISCKARRRVAGFHARNFSVSWHYDNWAYLLSVAVLSSPPPNGRQLLIYYTHAHVAGCVGPDTACKVLQTVPEVTVYKECGIVRRKYFTPLFRKLNVDLSSKAQ